MERKKLAWIPIAFGIILLLIGLLVKVPGGALTTKESLNGQATDYYLFDKTYSAIDEYVGGDAYNFIIGASLVAGRMSGAMVSRSVYIAGGLICICIGVMMMAKDKETDIRQTASAAPVSARNAAVQPIAEPEPANTNDDQSSDQ